ncbi:MAG: hypothetical protein NTY06_03125 [Candidatus Gottesmanbacteria bacterium]|nr:hypothetical protein [Candidatus Gottesmanbacteria bacterium]
MTAEIVVPGSKTIKLNKPGLTAKLFDAEGRKFLIYTNKKKDGVFVLYDELIGGFIIRSIEDRQEYAKTEGILFHAGHVTQLQGGSFLKVE